MLIKKKFAPLLFAALGALGFFMRKSELEAAYEPTSGLFEPWHIMTLIMYVLAAGAAVLALHFALSCRRGGGRKAAAEKMQWGIPHLAAGLTSAVLMGLGAYLFYSGLWYSTFELPWLEKLFVVFAAFCALCIAFLCCVLNKDKPGSAAKTVACVPPVFFCIWLLYVYRVNAVDPTVQVYVWQCLCLAFAALGTFFYAGFLYGAVSIGKAVWCLLMGEYTAIVAIADQASFDGLLLTSAAALWLAVLAHSAIGSLVKE